MEVFDYGMFFFTTYVYSSIIILNGEKIKGKDVFRHKDSKYGKGSIFPFIDTPIMTFALHRSKLLSCMMKDDVCPFFLKWWSQLYVASV